MKEYTRPFKGKIKLNHSKDIKTKKNIVTHSQGFANNNKTKRREISRLFTY
ncbi:MAG: hypothetical protein ACI9L6_000729 [Flavobacterium sp.]|jgi:hypothetical protein